MKAVILIRINELESAEKVLADGIAIDKDNIDINYNLEYLYQLKDKNKLFWNVVTHLSYFSKNVMIQCLEEAKF